MKNMENSNQSNPRVSPNPPQEANWRETLKQEIMEDVKSQMQGLTQELMKEIKPLLQPTTATPQPPTKERTMTTIFSC